MRGKEGLLLAVLLTGLTIIAACGGGGGGSNPAPSNNATAFSISGTITSSGTAHQGVTITLGGAGSATATTDVSGNFSFTSFANGSYTVTPSMTGYTFSPTSSAQTVNGANITGVNFTATATSSGTNYFPMTANSKWTYTNTSSSGTSTSSEIDEVVSSLTDTVSIKITSSPYSGNYMIFQTVKLSNGAWGISNWIQYDSGGNVTSTVTATPPQLFLPSSWAINTHETNTSTQSSTGNPMTVDINVVGMESVTVPAGTFNALKITKVYTYSSGSETNYGWYVNGIGRVKSSRLGDSYKSELISYSIH